MVGYQASGYPHSPFEECWPASPYPHQGGSRKDKVVEYRGKRITVAMVDGRHCPRCGEIEFARGEGKLSRLLQGRPLPRPR